MVATRNCLSPNMLHSVRMQASYSVERLLRDLQFELWIGDASRRRSFSTLYFWGAGRP